MKHRRKKKFANVQKRMGKIKFPIVAISVEDHPGKRKFTDRQRRYKMNRLSGMNQVDAALAAGYSYTTAHSKADRIEKLVQVDLLSILNQAGLTDKAMAKELKQLALHSVKSDSNLMRMVPDGHLRKESIELVAKLKKHLKGDTVVDKSEHTHLTVVVVKENEPEESRDPANSETEFSIRTTD
jgi:hypothetical protein